MSGRLRDSLYSYFAKHIECGDWISCLRVLRGCTAAGTPLHSLPYKTLFPLLVVNGQWESVLRLSSQLESGVGASASARASGGAKNDEAELCNALLRAALAPEALTDGGSWRAAVYVVQYAARKQLMLEPEVVRGMLRATESWSCGACSGAGGVSSCLNDSVRSDDQRKKDELLLARDTLLGMQLLGGKSFPACIAETCEVRESSKSPTIQVEMVLAVGEVFEESLKGDGSAASLCWSRLREQVRTIFALSWENAVYTLLRLCHCVHNATGVEVESHESIERVAEGHDLASLMRFVAINAAAQPHITRQILHMTLECLLDGNVIHVPHARATASGDPTDCDDAIMTSLPPWCAQLKRGWGAAAATELAKWRAVLSLVLTEVEQHERCWELEDSSPRLHRPSKRFLWRDDLTSLMMLSASARLVILGEMGVGEEHSGRLPCSAEPELLERVMRVLLFQGSLVATGASTDGYERRRRDAIIESVVETVQSIMDVFIFGFHSTNKCHVAEPVSTQERSGHPALPFDNVSGSSATDLKGGVRLAVSCARANLWANVLFPNKTYLSYDAHGGGGLCVLVAWQEILRDVFSNVSTLTMLFDDSDYVYRTSKGGYSCHTPTASSSISSGRELNDDPAGNQVSVHAGERKKTHVSKGAVFLSTEAMKHLEELIDFISRPVTRDPKMDASNKPCKYCTFNQRYCSDHYKWRVPPVQWCVNRIDTGGEVSNALSVPGLLTLLKHQYDTNRLGEALLQRCLKTDNGAAAVTGVTTALRLLIASIAKSHVKGLLRHLLKITTEGKVASQWQFCRLAVVAVLHETGAFHPGQKVRYSMQLLDSVEPRSKVWEASLMLFREAAISICRQHHEARQGSVVDGDSPIGRVSERNGTTTLSYIMDTLVVQSTPPRWCDALQIVEVLHWIAPCAGSVSGHSEKMVNSIPLSESEHIDLCEALASLRHRHQWADAAQLFKQYESRPLSNHDIAHFAFTFSRAPLSFIRRVLLKLDQQKNREVARTALEACARYVRKAELTDRILVCAHYDEKKSSRLREGNHLYRKSRNCHSEELDADALAQEQRRYILLHDVADVMLLALKSWPVPVTEESQFAYIWRTVLRGCAGDAEMARLLLKQSSIYNTAELQTEVMELMHTIALCHRTQDVGSAVSAYKQFCRCRMGLSVPRDTMLKLVELCVLGLDGEEEIGGRKADGLALDNVSLLCTVLVDTLAMHTIAENVGFKKDTSEERSIMVQVCTALFSLTEFPSVADNMMAFGADTFVDMIPKFKASMGPGVRRHGLRILQILTDHLVRSKAKFLRDLPSFVGVLLCASRELSIVASVNGQEGSVLTSLAELVEVLQNHIRNLEGQFGRLVPTACSFWLKVLKYSASEHLCGRKIHFGGVGADSSVWSPTRLILENNTANFCATQSLFQQVILRAMDDICREERTSVSVTYAAEHDALLRGKLMPHAIDAVIHMLHCRWGSHPPPAAILTGVSLPLQQVRLQRVASSNNTGVGMYCAASLYELTSLQSTLSIFYARHTLAHLAAAGSPASLLTPAVEATLTRAAYEAARCTSGYIELLSSCLHPLLCAAERGRLETEVCGTTRFGVLHVELMVQLTAQVAGICMAWPESSFKEKCCGELKRVCDVLRRVTRGNHASAVSAGRSTRLLIRVVGIVLDRKVMNESELDSLFREEAARSIADDDVGRADKLQHLVMAAALLQLVSSFSLSSGVLQDFVTTLHVDTNVIAALQKNADVFTGLVVVWLATFGAPASLLSRLAGHHLPLTSQLIEHIEGLLSFTFSTDGCFTTASAELQAILCSTDAPVELVVLSSLAALRRRELHLTDWKTVGTTALNGVVSAVPHRWDLALAVARGYPLLSTAPQQDDEGGQGGVAFRCALLQERLVTVAQSCGPWPRGVALQVLLEARYATASAVEKGGGKTTPASVLADFVELLEATSNLDARVMCRGFTLPRVWEIGIPPLVKFVRRKHLLEYRAVSIVLGTVQEQNDDDNRRYVLRSLLSCNSDTLFLALDHMFASAHGNKFLSSWRGGRSKKFIWSQDVCLSAFPWDALTSDAQHLVMWSWASPKLAEMAWGQTGKERPDSAVDSVVSMLATLSSISSSAKKSQTTTGIAIPITLSFPRALFNIAWASGVFKQHVSSFDAKDRPVTSSHLQSFGGCTPILGTLFGVPSPLKVSLDGSLLSIPCGFSAVQYVYASTDGDGLAAAERGFLLFLAGGCHSMEEITNALLKRMVSEPPTLEVVLAAWNVFCIRRVELGFAEVKEPKDPLKELPLKPSDVAVFIALVVRASCDDWNCSPKPDEDAHRQQRQRRKQLISEMFIHGGVAELSEGKCRPRGLTDGTAFRRACTRAAVAAVSIVKQHDQRLDHFTDASCFDSYIDSAF